MKAAQETRCLGDAPQCSKRLIYLQVEPKGDIKTSYSSTQASLPHSPVAVGPAPHSSSFPHPTAMAHISTPLTSTWL